MFTYRLLDVMKFVMALMVVNIHVQSLYHGTMSWFTSLAVPFFFASSGFLLESKIMKTSGEVMEQDIYSHYNRKCIERYLYWMLIYMPLSIIVACNNSRSALFDVAVYIRGVLFVGETSYSWPLWYLLALIVAIWIIRLLRRWHLNLRVICLMGILLNVSAWWYSHVDKSQMTGLLYYLDRCYTLVFVNTRNGIFVGLACVGLGMVSAHLPQMRKSLFIPIFLIILSFFLYKLDCSRSFDYPLSTVLGGLGIMLLSICPPLSKFFISGKYSRQISSLSKYLRLQSVWVYFIHMYILVFLKYTFPIQSVSVYALWLIAALLATGLSASLIALSKTSPFRWLKNLQ